jgi:hypothetical protein
VLQEFDAGGRWPPVSSPAHEHTVIMSVVLKSASMAKRKGQA